MAKFKTAAEFIENAHKKEQVALEQEKEELLLSLNLVDEEKTVRMYSEDCDYPYVNWDNDVKKWYYNKKYPLEVTDEEFLEIKRIVARKNGFEPTTQTDNTAEKLLNAFNVVTLIIGLLGAVLVLLATFIEGISYLFAGAVALTIITLLSWAKTKVIINISNNLHEINKKQK